MRRLPAWLTTGAQPARLPHKVQSARELVMRYGWNATAYQILNPGIQHWFHPNGEAVVGYLRKHRYLLVAGAPVCAAGDLSAIAQAFEQYAARQSCRVCYVCAAQRLRDLFQHSPRHCEIAVGKSGKRASRRESPRGCAYPPPELIARSPSRRSCPGRLGDLRFFAGGLNPRRVQYYPHS